MATHGNFSLSLVADCSPPPNLYTAGGDARDSNHLKLIPASANNPSKTLPERQHLSAEKA
ncbi:MAG: hypothetical protein ACJAWP_001354 [Porticoccus sp.]